MSPITVTRVYCYTDWVRGIGNALWELWRSFFGCHHKWETIRFQHLMHKGTRDGGTWVVNKCRKCAKTHVHGTWSPSTRVE